MTTLESLPDTWDADRDEPFFRITARLLPSAVVAGASALLASYDQDDAVAPRASTVEQRSSGETVIGAAGVERRVP